MSTADVSELSRKGLWRVGRKVGRTIYVMVADEPSDDDQLIGMMDTPRLARRVIVGVNSLIIKDRLNEQARRTQ